MTKIHDYLAIAKGALTATKTIVNEGVGMAKEFGGMVGQVRQLFPKRKEPELEVEVTPEPPANDETGEHP